MGSHFISMNRHFGALLDTYLLRKACSGVTTRLGNQNYSISGLFGSLF